MPQYCRRTAARTTKARDPIPSPRGPDRHCARIPSAPYRIRTSRIGNRQYCL